MEHDPGAIVPIDLVSVVALCGVVTSLIIQHTGPAVIRIPLGFIFVLFAPGYALAAVLFPYNGNRSKHGAVLTEQEGTWGQITFVERLVVSVGLSVAIVPLAGLVLGYSPWGYNPTVLTVTIASLTIIAAIAGTIRRWTVPSDQRFIVPTVSIPTHFAAFIGKPATSREETLVVVIILGLVVSTAGIGFAATVPGNGERFTEFHIQAQDADSGAIEPDAYPNAWAVAEPVDVVVGLTNQEGETVEYTIVVQQQQLGQTTDGYEVTDRTELDRLDVTVGAGETWSEQLEVIPTESSDNARIAYLLYVGEPPDEPTAETAYRTVHLSAGGDTDETGT